MLNPIVWALWFTACTAIAVMPSPEPALLTPEPWAFRFPGRPRPAGRHQETIEEANTIEWLNRVKQIDSGPDRFTIGIDRRGNPVNVKLVQTSAPPWHAAEPPARKSMSMIPDRVPVPDQVPAPEPEPPREAQAWQPGDDADPPTLVRGMRAILADDLEGFLDDMPGYG